MKFNFFRKAESPAADKLTAEQNRMITESLCGLVSGDGNNWNLETARKDLVEQIFNLNRQTDPASLARLHKSP